MEYFYSKVLQEKIPKWNHPVLFFDFSEVAIPPLNTDSEILLKKYLELMLVP